MRIPFVRMLLHVDFENGKAFVLLFLLLQTAAIKMKLQPASDVQRLRAAASFLWPQSAAAEKAGRRLCRFQSQREEASERMVFAWRIGAHGCGKGRFR